MESGIREVQVQRDDSGRITEVFLVFGPHYFVRLTQPAAGETRFVLGATHHGFAADASQVGGELERIIEQVRSAHPHLMVD